MDALALVASQPGQQQGVDARELHSALRIGRDFTTWVRDQIERCGFVEGKDYVVSQSPNLGTGDPRHTGGSPTASYTLSFGAAKLIALSMPRSPESAAARQHLIRIEEAWNTPELVLARALQMASGMLARAKEEAAQATALLSEAQPKLEAYERLQAAQGGLNIQAAGKAMHVPPRAFVSWLVSQRYAFRTLPDKKGRTTILPYSDFEKAGYFRVVTFAVGDPPRTQQQTLVTPKGLHYFAPRVGSQLGQN